MSSNDKKSIIVVEDEPSLVFTLKDTLENEGYNVHVVEEGSTAVENVQRINPDLMLLDLMLPGKSGYDICREVRELNYTFPIIMLTARDQEIDKVTGLNIGADDYITKPFGVKELLARINARLRRANTYTSKSALTDRLVLDPVVINLKESTVQKPDEEPVVLTARDQEIDKVTGLNIGADDYITKPFGVKELLARINARLRRANTYTSKSALTDRLVLDPVVINLKESTVQKPDEEPVVLTAREVELIRYLIPRANEPVTRDELLEKVWRYEFSTNTRTVDVHISKLRAKIEMHPDDPRYLVTLHGVGYMLKMG